MGYSVLIPESHTFGHTLREPYLPTVGILSDRQLCITTRRLCPGLPLGMPIVWRIGFDAAPPTCLQKPAFFPCAPTGDSDAPGLFSGLRRSGCFPSRATHESNAPKLFCENRPMCFIQPQPNDGHKWSAPRAKELDETPMIATRGAGPPSCLCWLFTLPASLS